MIYQMTYPPILNYLQMIPLFFQLYTTKTFQQMNIIIRSGKLVTEGQSMENELQPQPSKASSGGIFSTQNH